MVLSQLRPTTSAPLSVFVTQHGPQGHQRIRGTAPLISNLGSSDKLGIRGSPQARGSLGAGRESTPSPEPPPHCSCSFQAPADPADDGCFPKTPKHQLLQRNSHFPGDFIDPSGCRTLRDQPKARANGQVCSGLPEASSQTQPCRDFQNTPLVLGHIWRCGIQPRGDAGDVYQP